MASINGKAHEVNEMLILENRNLAARNIIVRYEARQLTAGVMKYNNRKPYNDK